MEDVLAAIDAIETLRGIAAPPRDSGGYFAAEGIGSLMERAGLCSFELRGRR